MKRILFFVFLIYAAGVEAQNSNKVIPTDSVSMLIREYSDSLQAYRQRLDSLMNLGKSVTDTEGSAVDYSRLFMPVTFYNSIAHRQFDLSGYENSSTTPFQREIDNTLLNLYLYRPDLVSMRESELQKDGKNIAPPTKVIDYKPSMVEKVAPVVEDPDVAPVDVLVKRPNFWNFAGDVSLKITQNYISGNWYQGGNSNFTLLGALTLQANYNNKQKVKWDNKLEIRTGMTSSVGDSLHNMKVSENLIRYTGKLGFQASKHWYYSFQLIASTQVLRAYAANSPTCYTDILAPIIINPSVGMDYTFSFFKKKLTGTLNLAPIAYNYKYCSRDRLVTRYGIEEGHRHVDDFGSQFTLNFVWKFTNNIFWKLYAKGYTSYKRVELQWENTFHFTVNKYLAADLFINPRFDDNRARDDHHGYWQFKEWLSFGLSYSLW